MAITPIAVGDVIRVTWFNRYYGQVIETVLHQRCTIAPTGGTPSQQMQDVADTQADDATCPFLDAYVSATVPAMSFERVRVQKVWPQREVYFESITGDVGSQTGAGISPNSAASITKRSTVFGRTGVGRMQLCGLPITAVAAGLIVTGYFAFIDAIAATIRGLATPGQVYLGAYHMCLPRAAITGYNDFDIIATSTHNEVRTMHRRTVGLGI